MTTTKRIFVDREAVQRNADSGTHDPIFVVLESGKLRKGGTVIVMGPSVFKYNPNGCPECGSRAWLETAAQIILQDDTGETIHASVAEDCAPCRKKLDKIRPRPLVSSAS